MLRFLADENFPGDAVKVLTRIGFDVAWILKDAPGSSDEEVLKRATKEKRILITFDIVEEAIKSRDDWAGYFSVVEMNRIRMKPIFRLE
jgi:predicted nuclease of predicted toxin-antitoxin system